MTTLFALKQALAFAVSLLHMSALGTALAGVLRVHHHYHATLSLSFVPNAELQPVKRPLVQHGPRLLPQFGSISDPVQVLHRNYIPLLKGVNYLATGDMEHISDEAVFLALNSYKVSFARVSHLLQFPPQVFVSVGGMGQLASSEELVRACDGCTFDPRINSYHIAGQDRVFDIVLHAQMQEDFVVLDKKISGAWFPGQELLVVFWDFEFELSSAIQKTDGAGSFLDPDGEATSIKSDRTELRLGTRSSLAFFDSSLDRTECFSSFDPSGAAELGGETEGFALFIGFLMEADAVGIGVRPATITDEVEGFGIGGESGKDIFRDGLEREFEGSCQFHT